METKVVAMDATKQLAELKDEQIQRQAKTLSPEEDKNMSPHEKMQARAKAMMQPFIMKLEAYDIPDEKLEAVIDYAVYTFAKYHQHMKEHRMLRKVVEEFKLQPKPVTDDLPTS